MPQLVTRVDDALTEAIDRLVADGVVANRSEAVRRALEQFVEAERRRAVGESIVAGYRARPQDDAEVGWSDDATVAMIADEPW